jgi:hypothetical protein
VDVLLSEGPCAWHRRSFAPVRMILAGEQLSLDLLMRGELPTDDDFEDWDPADEPDLAD